MRAATPAQRPELLQGELQADREEQEGDAKFADELDVLDLFDESRDRGANNEAANYVANDERRTKQDGEIAADDRREHEEDQLPGDASASGQDGKRKVQHRFLS